MYFHQIEDVGFVYDSHTFRSVSFNPVQLAYVENGEYQYC